MILRVQPDVRDAALAALRRDDALASSEIANATGRSIGEVVPALFDLEDDGLAASFTRPVLGIEHASPVRLWKLAG